MTHQTFKHAVTRPIDINDTSITNGFWKQIVDQSRNVGLPALLSEYEDRPVVQNFIDAACGRPRAKERNGNNHDEFLFKALEACNYYLGEAGTGDLRKQYERIRDIVLAAQEDDGYLNTLAIQTNTPHHSANTSQELYAGGHLMQAGIAERRISGQDVLFDAAKRYIDCLIEAYGLNGQKLNRLAFRGKWPDHPNLETALVDLYRETGDNSYLTFCNCLLACGEYRDRTQMLNHAVCEMLHVTGATDYYLETGDEAVWAATLRLWNDLLKKVYITGGFGSTHRGNTYESVGKEFALTNDQAYAETCASISLVFWSWKMFLATGESRFIDMLERTLYNGVLCGMSDDGCKYFYENPLEYRAVTAKGSASTDVNRADFRGDRPRRESYHHCSCCPPNVQRLIASLQQYVYSTEGLSIWVNLYVGSQASVVVAGRSVTLEQETEYPRNGKVTIRIGVQDMTVFALKVRIPEWCNNASVAINNARVKSDVSKGYVTAERSWADGDTVTVNLSMPAQLVRCHPKNIANYEKLVITRGPLIYCLEADDNPDIDIFSVVLPAEIQFEECRIDSLEGIIGLVGSAQLRDDSDWDAAPYQLFKNAGTPRTTPVKITAIPYYAWANRGRSSMLTALPYVKG